MCFGSNCRGLHSQYSARDWLMSAFVYTAMVNYATAANFMAPLPGYPVEQVRYSLCQKVCHQSIFFFTIRMLTGFVLHQMCKIVDGFPRGSSNLDRAFAAASLYYNYSGSEKCFELEQPSDDHGLDGWGWQVIRFPLFSKNVRV